MEYKPITRKEILDTLVSKFGAVETARYFLSDAISDLQTMEVGLAENNPLKAAEVCGSLRESLSNLRTLLEKKENKGPIEREVREQLP